MSILYYALFFYGSIIFHNEKKGELERIGKIKSFYANCYWVMTLSLSMSSRRAKSSFKNFVLHSYPAIPLLGIYAREMKTHTYTKPVHEYIQEHFS